MLFGIGLPCINYQKRFITKKEPFSYTSRTVKPNNQWTEINCKKGNIDDNKDVSRKKKIIGVWV